VLDIILIAVGCGTFALAIAYAYACDKLWGARHANRIHPRQRRDARPPGLSGLRTAAPRALL